MLPVEGVRSYSPKALILWEIVSKAKDLPQVVWDTGYWKATVSRGTDCEWRSSLRCSWDCCRRGPLSAACSVPRRLPHRFRWCSSWMHSALQVKLPLDPSGMSCPGTQRHCRKSRDSACSGQTWNLFYNSSDYSSRYRDNSDYVHLVPLYFLFHPMMPAIRSDDSFSDLSEMGKTWQA